MLRLQRAQLSKRVDGNNHRAHLTILGQDVLLRLASLQLVDESVQLSHRVANGAQLGIGHLDRAHGRSFLWGKRNVSLAGDASDASNDVYVAFSVRRCRHNAARVTNATHDKRRAARDSHRKFLALHLLHPEDDIVPCKFVDEMWHRHILDTAAYRADCDAVFGQFLDHFPYFGMRGADDALALQDAYADTLDRYRRAFGEPPEDTWVSRDAASCRRTNCKPQKCRWVKTPQGVRFRRQKAGFGWAFCRRGNAGVTCTSKRVDSAVEARA